MYSCLLTIDTLSPEFHSNYDSAECNSVNRINSKVSENNKQLQLGIRVKSILRRHGGRTPLFLRVRISSFFTECSDRDLVTGVFAWWM